MPLAPTRGPAHCRDSDAKGPCPPEEQEAPSSPWSLSSAPGRRRESSFCGRKGGGRGTVWWHLTGRGSQARGDRAQEFRVLGHPREWPVGVQSHFQNHSIDIFCVPTMCRTLCQVREREGVRKAEQVTALRGEGPLPVVKTRTSKQIKKKIRNNKHCREGKHTGRPEREGRSATRAGGRWGASKRATLSR